MKKILLALVLMSFVAAGCKDMTNEEIISETKKCKDAGMEIYQLYNVVTYKIADIQCTNNAKETTKQED